jgi:Ala-tRNA(Pro) deacylase
MAIAITLKDYMDNHDLEYEVVSHEKSNSSTETAQQAHVPGDKLAKTVVLEDEQGYVIVVVPATHRVEMGTVQRYLQRQVKLADEPELQRIFTDCELGALPPVGDPYGVETMLDDSLAEQTDIYFEAGDHEALIHMTCEQFELMMADAEHGSFSHHM